jgi:hypothetical protein
LAAFPTDFGLQMGRARYLMELGSFSFFHRERDPRTAGPPVGRCPFFANGAKGK